MWIEDCNTRQIIQWNRVMASSPLPSHGSAKLAMACAVHFAPDRCDPTVLIFSRVLERAASCIIGTSPRPKAGRQDLIGHHASRGAVCWPSALIACGEAEPAASTVQRALSNERPPRLSPADGRPMRAAETGCKRYIGPVYSRVALPLAKRSATKHQAPNVRC